MIRLCNPLPPPPPHKKRGIKSKIKKVEIVLHTYPLRAKPPNGRPREADVTREPSPNGITKTSLSIQTTFFIDTSRSLCEQVAS